MMQTIWTQILPSSSTIKCGAVACNGKSVYVGNPLQHYSYDPFQQNRTLPSPRSLTTQMKLSKNERFLALASDIVDLMDLERLKVVRQFTEHTNAISGICSEPSSPHIWATVGMDKTMRVFDSRQHPGQTLCIRNDYRHRCITYAPNSQMLFCGGENIFIFDVRANTEFGTIKTANQVLDLNCHPEDCVLVGCTDDRMIKVWDMDSKECLTQSFPFESQPQKVQFEGNSVLACTYEKLYLCDWEPFEVISQFLWSKSKESKLMVMDGESRLQSLRPDPMLPMNAAVNTLDIKVQEDTVFHLGLSESSKFDRSLTLRSIQVEHLLHPQAREEEDDHHQSFSLNERIPTPVESFNGKFDPICSSTFINQEEDPAAILVSSSLMLSPSKTPANGQPLIRKLPRSTSSSRSNLMKLQSQSPKKSPSLIAPQPAGSIRARSSSTNSLHGSLQRTNSGSGIEKKSKDTPKSLPQHPRQSRQSTHHQPLAAKNTRRQSGGAKTFEEMRSTNSNFLAMVRNRKAGVQRVKATMKSRHNNEDEVFDEAINLPDKSAFVHLLQQLSSKPIGLRLAARILPEIRFLLAHKNSNYADVALDVLDAIVTQLKESIKQGIASNAQSLGVDIAAEQRQQNCIKCKEALTEIYVNVHFLTAKFNEEQTLYFNSILDKFVDFVS